MYYTQSRHAGTGEKRNTWAVFLGLEKHTECATLQAATEVARTLTKKHRRGAWLHDATGYPLKPIVLGRRSGPTSPR
ncbi:MAG TPA: hypothetical protein VEH53_05180 [archaeon]|nr:hypothetical protein [archaeon]